MQHGLAIVVPCLENGWDSLLGAQQIFPSKRQFTFQIHFMPLEYKKQMMMMMKKKKKKKKKPFGKSFH
jgi:hypothetical protein